MFKNFYLYKKIGKLGLAALAQNLGYMMLGLMMIMVFRFLPNPAAASYSSSNPDANLNWQYWQMLYGTIYTIFVLFANPLYGLTISARTFANYNYGHGNYERTHRAAVFSLASCGLFLIGIELVFIIFGQQLISLFGVHNGMSKNFGDSHYIFWTANRDA